MSYLKMAMQALESMEVATTEGGNRDHNPPAKVANLHPVKTPQAITPEHILTCADCSFHEYQGPNPAHGWGHCTFKGKWCYGLRQACDECKETGD
jgi:hypothetical protein